MTGTAGKLEPMADTAPRIARCSIFRTPHGQIGFRCWFDGQPPHFEMGAFDSVEAALSWIDPHHERVWIRTEEADAAELLVSNAFVPGSLPDRISRMLISRR